MNDRCTTCHRKVWLASGPITVEYCDVMNGTVCRLVNEKNTLVATMRFLLKNPNDTAVRRTAAVLTEDIAPASNACPLCNEPYVVRDRYVKVHYAKVSDAKPCPASFKNTASGVILK